MAPTAKSDQVFLVLNNGTVSSVHASEESALDAVGDTKMLMEPHTVVGGTVNIVKEKKTKAKATKTDDAPAEKKTKEIKPKPAKSAAPDDAPVEKKTKKPKPTESAATDDTIDPAKKTKSAAEQLAENADKPPKGEIDVKSLPDNIQKLLKGSGSVFEGMTVVVTGIPPVMGRKVADTLVELYGGKLVKSLSKKTDLVFLGNTAGPKKLEKIKEYDLKTVDEHEFVRMIEKAGASKKRAASDEDAKPKAAKKSKK